MMRSFDRVSMTRAQAARAFWRRSAARFRLRLYGLPGYPWPTQRSPKLVFAVLVARWLTNYAAKERAKSAGRLSNQPRREAIRRQSAVSYIAGRSTRGAVRQQALSIAKTLRMPARVAPGNPVRAIVERRVPYLTTSRRTIAHGRVALPDRAIAYQRAAAAPGEFVKTRWPGRDRISSEVGTRFVERSSRTVFVTTAAPRPATTNDACAWRSPRLAARVMVQSDRRSREAAVPRRVDASRSRAAVSARSMYRAHRSTNRRTVDSFASSSRSVHRYSEPRGDDSRKGRARQLPFHDRVLTLRPVHIHRIASAAPIVCATQGPRAALARPQYRWGRTDLSALRFLPRHSDAQPAAAVVRRTVRRAASTPRRFLTERSISLRAHAVVALASYDLAARPAMIVQHGTESTSSREQATTGARQAHTTKDSRARPASHESDRSDNRSPRPPAAEEVRRILIPLLQETLFSERIMGRLANGVVSEADRRDNVERYRKSGGR